MDKLRIIINVALVAGIGFGPNRRDTIAQRGATAAPRPWTGLEATTRAYAKIIDEVNKLPLSDLQRPEEPAPQRGSGPGQQR